VSQGRKFIHVSLRIPVELKSELENQAKQQSLNLNSLSNIILLKHVLFDRIVDRVEGVPLNKLLFTAMLDGIGVDQMEIIGRELGPRVIKHTFAVMNLPFDLDGLIQNYFQPMSTYSRWYKFSVAGGISSRKLMFEHSYGQKWSAFLKQYLTGILKPVVGSEPKVVIDDGLISIFC
jgi:hypothetical protein